MTIEEAIKDSSYCLDLREIYCREEVGNPRQGRRDQDALKKKLCTCKLGSRFTCINIHYHGNHFFPEEVGHTFINVRSHVPFAALYYIPRCIPACN